MSADRRSPAAHAERGAGGGPLSEALSTLVSQTLVAWTIEFDNEFERRVRGLGTPPHFGVSFPFWANLMRLVDPDGVTIAELAAAAGIPPPLSGVGGMERWGYLTVDGAGKGERRPGFGSARGLRAQAVLRPTRLGRVTQDVWAPLPAAIDERWATRLGRVRYGAIRTALIAVAGQLAGDLPLALPVLGAGDGFASHVTVRASPDHAAERSTGSLLSQVLLAVTLAHDGVAATALPVCADFLGVIPDDGIRVKDVPLAAGVSTEAVAMALTHLTAQRLVTVETAAGGKVVRVTPGGRAALVDAVQTAAATAADLRRRAPACADLEASLLALRAPGPDGAAWLSAGLETPDGGWRTTKPYAARAAAYRANPAGALPYYPLVLHRGGWPDGS